MCGIALAPFALSEPVPLPPHPKWERVQDPSTGTGDGDHLLVDDTGRSGQQDPGSMHSTIPSRSSHAGSRSP